MQETQGLIPWVKKIPWGRKWQHTPVFLPGESHGQKSLVGYSPWGCKRGGHNLTTKQQQQIVRYKPLKYLCLNNLMVAWTQVIERKNLYSILAAAAAKSLQSCLTLCDPMDCSLPGSSIHGIFQARTLEWVAISSLLIKERNVLKLRMAPGPSSIRCILG